MDVLDGVAELCVGVATEVRLVDCTDLSRRQEDEESDVSVVPEEVEDDTEELPAVD